VFIILLSEFQKAMLFRDSSLLEQIFRVFDTDQDGCISFTEFISCLSTFSSKGTPEEKLKCIASIYCHLPSNHRFHISLMQFYFTHSVIPDLRREWRQFH
jgi:hypothetical protein